MLVSYLRSLPLTKHRPPTHIWFSPSRPYAYFKGYWNLAAHWMHIPQHMMPIDTFLTIPERTVEAETQRRIAAINAIAAFCGVEDGAPLCHSQSEKRAATKTIAPIQTKRKTLGPYRRGVMTLMHSLRPIN